MAFPDTPAPTNRNITTPKIEVLFDDGTIDTDNPPTNEGGSTELSPGTMFWAN